VPEECYMNISNGNNNNRAGIDGVDEHGDDIENDRTNNTLGGGRPRQNRGACRNPDLSMVLARGLKLSVRLFKVWELLTKQLRTYERY
jgi:hypothetical protein